MTRHEPDPIFEISKIHKELSHFGIKLLPPHMIKSHMDFEIEGDNIRFGLLSIKGISDKSIEKLNNFKNNYSNKFEIFQAAQEAGIGLNILCPLIQAGALEGFRQSRTKVVYEAQLWGVLTDREKRFCLILADEFHYDLVAVLRRLEDKLDEKGKPIIKESRSGTIRRNMAPYKEIYEINKPSENFANWYYENSLLGFTYNKTLIDIFEDKDDSLVSIGAVASAELGDNISFVGRIEGKPKTGISRVKKTNYIKMLVGDEGNFIKVMLFSKHMKACKNINNGYPKENQIVIVKGRKMEDVVFATHANVQDNRCYTRLRDLTNDKKRLTAYKTDAKIQ